MAPVTKRQKIGIALTALSLTFEDVKKKRRMWAKKWLIERKKFSHITLLNELDGDDFRNYLRMDYDCFNELLNLVSPLISKQNTHMRDAVSAEERLVATLRYLATGRDYADLKFSTAISPQLLSKIIPETCNAIFKVLRTFIKIPTTENEWMETAKQFENKWQFNNCIGAMDGKHVLINKPQETGSLYYNYKGTFSVVLFAVVTSNYEFMYVHTGINGSVSDGGVLKHTEFYKKLTSGELMLPQPTLLPNTNIYAPHVFLGDSARIVTHDKRIFNYRLSRARRVVENVFGILSSRFQIFKKPILVDVKNIDILVLACCSLHNFLRKKSNNYKTNDCVDTENLENGTFKEGDWRREETFLNVNQNNQRYTTEEGKMIRNIFKDYFNGIGSVHFQETMINALGDYN
ncbi:hypothetical protein AGLY_015736, partial [Aphis glycines]